MFRSRDDAESITDLQSNYASDNAQPTIFGNFMDNPSPQPEKKEVVAPAASAVRPVYQPSPNYSPSYSHAPASSYASAAPQAVQAPAYARPVAVAPAAVQPAEKPIAQPISAAAEAVARTNYARPASISDVTPSKPATYKLSPAGAISPIAAAPAPAATATSSVATRTNLNNGANLMDKIETEKRLTVGYGIVLEGKISNCDKLIVYGSVHADLTDVKTLHISESGKFTGFADIENAEISGNFEGDLIVSNTVTINSTGKMSGKVTYGSIEIKPGGKFTGQIIDAADAELSPKAKRARRKAAEEGQEQFSLSPEPVEDFA